jgi:crotonobetainyl-CoA:carnitine CoA-transferase CaiB-like acyl-CoA transferase
VGQLKGIRVLELASVLAGPGVGQFFAELGAEVIKIENLKTAGDVTRTWKSPGEQTDDRSAYFCSVNWGKQSIALDLSTFEGQNIVQELAFKSSIVIASYKPGDAEKLRVDYKTLSQNNPGLIYGQITGYGPKNDRVGYDAIIQAEAGFMFMNGESGGESLKMPVALMDVLAGHHLKEAILLAMLERSATGKGKLVEVSLIQSAVASLANQATNWLIGNSLPVKKGSAHPNIAPYGDVFTTKDDLELILAVGSDQQFKNLCKILELDIAGDPRFMTNSSRVIYRADLNAQLSPEIAKHDSMELMNRLNLNKIPAGVINSMKEVFKIPEVSEMLINSSGLRSVKTYAGPSNPDVFAHILPPPHFGEHSRTVLSEILNFASEKIDLLTQAAIIR